MLGGAKKEVSLEESVFGVEIKPHLVHEAVRSELNAHRRRWRSAQPTTTLHEKRQGGPA